ncbi:MAG: hypothetical protein J5613_00380 [Alphaproteobacteria bacterium]|nr:hypothetical protein [Alphaproteobacteria bacterium]
MILEIIDGINCRVTDIQDGDLVPVGGSTLNSRFSKFVKVDSNKFEGFFEKVARNAARLAKDINLQKWVNSAAPGVDINMFAHMYAFGNVFRMVYPDAFKNSQDSANFYDEPKSLSEAVNAGVCTCKEIALLAQLYFQTQNIPTKYIGGELVRQIGYNGERHSFISFVLGGHNYIYDPANPVNKSEPVMPRIHTIDITADQRQKFEEKIHRESETANKTAFLISRPVYTSMASNVWYYGFNDFGVDFEPEFIMNPDIKPVYEPVQNHKM